MGKHYTHTVWFISTQHSHICAERQHTAETSYTSSFRRHKRCATSKYAQFVCRYPHAMAEIHNICTCACWRRKRNASFTTTSNSQVFTNREPLSACKSVVLCSKRLCRRVWMEKIQLCTNTLKKTCLCRITVRVSISIFKCINSPKNSFQIQCLPVFFSQSLLIWQYTP